MQLRELFVYVTKHKVTKNYYVIRTFSAIPFKKTVARQRSPTYQTLSFSSILTFYFKHLIHRDIFSSKCFETTISYMLILHFIKTHVDITPQNSNYYRITCSILFNYSYHQSLIILVPNICYSS